MNKYLVVLLLLLTPKLIAQGVAPVNLTVFSGNAFKVVHLWAGLSSAPVITATAYTSEIGIPLAVNQQPTVTVGTDPNVQGQFMSVVSYASSSNLPSRFFLTIKLAGQVFEAGPVIVNRDRIMNTSTVQYTKTITPILNVTYPMSYSALNDKPASLTAFSNSTSNYQSGAQVNSRVNAKADSVLQLQTNGLALKVDKQAGKDLSTNDLTNAYKRRLDSLYQYLAGKVSVQIGKDLSSNDFTNAYKNRNDSLYTYLAGKQNKLTFDSAPTASSSNPVTSSGVKTALNAKSATIYATTYANAQAQCAALDTNVGALVKVAADESPGNAGTGPGGANPTTYYLYFPGVGLIQQVTYPNN